MISQLDDYIAHGSASEFSNSFAKNHEEVRNISRVSKAKAVDVATGIVNGRAGEKRRNHSLDGSTLYDSGLRFDFVNNSISGLSNSKRYDDLPLQDPTRVKLFSYHELTYTGPFFVGAPGGSNSYGHTKMDFLKSMVYDTGSEMCWAFDGSASVTCCPEAVCDPVRKKVSGCAAKSKSWFSWGSGDSNHCPATFTPFKHGVVDSDFVVCYGRGFAKGRMSNSLVSFSKQQQGVSFPFGVASQTSDVQHDFGGCSGLIGLGPKDTQQHPSVVATLFRQGIIAEPIFSFNLMDVDSAEFILGGLDPSIV